MRELTQYTTNDLTNAFIGIQEIITRVGKYDAKLKERLSHLAHECLLSVSSYSLEQVRANFSVLDNEVIKVGKYNQALKENLQDESDVCFNIAAELVEGGGEE